MTADGRISPSEGEGLYTSHSAAPEVGECTERTETGRGGSTPVQTESWRATS